MDVRRLLSVILLYPVCALSHEDSPCTLSEDTRIEALKEMRVPVLQALEGTDEKPFWVLGLDSAILNATADHSMDDAFITYTKGEHLAPVDLRHSCIAERDGCSIKYSECIAPFDGSEPWCEPAYLKCEVVE
jgi:hypothetical protein